MRCPYCGHKKTVRAGYSRVPVVLSAVARQRYKCCGCQRRWSNNYYSMSYCSKKRNPVLNERIFYLCVHGLSNRMIGKMLGVSEHCVRGRIKKLAQRGFVYHNAVMRGVRIEEAVAYDGLENFAGSQNDVNNIQQVVGSESLFIYDFNYAAMNRKGYQSKRQKEKVQEIERKRGRYNPSNIRLTTQRILRRVYEKRREGVGMIVLSDEHFQYRRAIEKDMRGLEIEHKTVSSKACRNYQNILFSVNHVDMMIRHQVRAFTRETIGFSKTAGAMCQKYVLYMILKNYMRPQFSKEHKRRPRAHEQSPAEVLGVRGRLMGYRDIFSVRSTKKDVQDLDKDWARYWAGLVPEDQLRSKKYMRGKESSVVG